MVISSVLVAAPAQAQSGEAAAPRPHHLVLTAGASWSGPYAVGDSIAELRSSGTGATPRPFTLFATSSRIDQAVGGTVRAGLAVSSSVVLDVGGTFSRPSLTTKISQDTERATPAVASESLEQFVIHANATWYTPLRVGRRVRVFASGGAGYLRQLHEERALVETGRIYYAGGGVSYWLRGGHGATTSLGLRSDVLANWRTGGIDWSGKTRVYPTLTVLLFLGL